ncbi:MAG TPA: hypothetical protein VL742_03490 [Casimicrobiaceae bacterium]|nr:hypothetical protein [Casimicrobiaceae bacterium]
MKIERMNLGALFPMFAAGMLFYAGVAYPQTEKKIIEKPGEPPIALHRVTEKSPTVNLSAVGKEVAPGIFEVDPSSIRDKRLVIEGKEHACLGKWLKTRQGPVCEGSWVQGM